MRKSILAIGILVVLLQGCIVKSLHPFYKESDVVFRKQLVNTWVDQDSNRWVIKPFAKKPNAYEMHWRHHGEKDVVMLANLFTLNGNLYFDFYPLSDNREEQLVIFDLHLTPTHSIAKVQVLNENEVQIQWFNEEWLRSLFEQNRIKISHEAVRDEDSQNPGDKYYVLTASTDELQKFIIKYGNDPKAFDNSNNNNIWLKLKKPA
jgi:hypothetical protein